MRCINLFVLLSSLARQCAELWVKTRETLGHPLGISEDILVGRPTVGMGKVAEDRRAFILEIGTEEMPHHDVVDASEQLRSLTVQMLEKRRLIHGEVLTYGTPRRLVVSEAAFETKEEKALWSSYKIVASNIQPGVDIGVFVNTSVQLLQPLEDFFDNAFVMAEDPRQE